MAVEFRVLGPVEVRVDGRSVPVGYAKQRCVLALLLFDVGRVVPVEQMIDRVWGVGAPDSVRNILYGHIARLRTALSETGAWSGEEPLRRLPGGYLLDADPATVDLHRFRAMVREARAANDHTTTAAILGHALDLWRGPALAGTDGPWAGRIRVTLDGERLAAMLDRYDAQLELGLHEGIVSELTDLLTQFPLHEGVASRLMLALYRTGHVAESLDCFIQVRGRLVYELGTEPGAELRSLHQRILRRDPAILAQPMR